ncbi:hypothetical protein [Treponema primitia]|uniref:hypothetical protein n=1 Tax=Treponema primitia TaxID=88058 RepID=UPI0002D2BF6E|nr:hypothetical protein [Treponema primitia]
MTNLTTFASTGKSLEKPRQVWTKDRGFPPKTRKTAPGTSLAEFLEKMARELDSVIDKMKK